MLPRRLLLLTILTMLSNVTNGQGTVASAAVVSRDAPELLHYWQQYAGNMLEVILDVLDCVVWTASSCAPVLFPCLFVTWGHATQVSLLL